MPERERGHGKKIKFGIKFKNGNVWLDTIYFYKPN